MTTIYVVDDEEPIRDSLRWLLESKGYKVRLFISAEDFLREYVPEPPECLILDIRMPQMSGLELQEKLATQKYKLPIIFITGHGDVPMAVSALKKGAADFIEKPFNDKELIALIEECITKDGKQREIDQQQASMSSRLAQLSPREHEVLQKIAAGKLNKIIADELQISIKTVEVHRAHIMAKTGANSLAELMHIVLSDDRYRGE